MKKILSRSEMNQQFVAAYRYLEQQGIIRLNDREHSKSKFAEQLGTKPHILDDYLNHKRTITHEKVRLLCEHFGINPEYMFYGKGSITASHSPDPLPTPLGSSSPTRGNILYSNLNALASFGQAQQTPEEATYFSLPGLEGELVAFTIKGDSMQPTLNSGDLAICRPIEYLGDIRDNDIYAIATREQGVMLKRLQVVRRNGTVHYRCISDNYLEHQPFMLPASDITGVFRLIRKVSSL